VRFKSKVGLSYQGTTGGTRDTPIGCVPVCPASAALSVGTDGTMSP